MVALLAAGCSGGDNDASSPPTPTVAAARSATPPTATRVTLTGTLTLDGAPLTAQFLGARVTRDGLAAACQADVTEAAGGRYRIQVLADAESRGCGATGASIMLWAFTDDYVFSQETLPWPAQGAAVEFNATFSSTAPAGASKPVTEFKGNLFDRDGTALPSGTVVSAFVGETLCGVSSLRGGGANDGLYTLIVAGPEALPACAVDAELRFLLDGEPAAETARNDLGVGRDPRAKLDLTLR